MLMTRRQTLVALLAAALLGACATHSPTSSTQTPIVFVHGNGDTAALWTTTLWRFESNGWPRARLHAIDMPYPLARDDDAQAQAGRTSTSEHMQFLAAEVEKLRKSTGAAKVILIGSSRGGNAIRNYIANGGGAQTVSHAILGGTPNHGVWANKDFRPGSEFNGAGPFLTALNTPRAPDAAEVTPGVKWMTVRSDNNDLYAQPDGAFIGARGQPTYVTFEGPALKGATNVVLPGLDHRETSFHPSAFAKAYEFITGVPPATMTITPEANVVLDGKLSGLGIDNSAGNFASNLPLVGATLDIYRTNAATGERIGGAVHRKTIGADGMWGPFKADGNASYEFVIAAPGYATTHIYRSAFVRSSNIVNLRAQRLADADKDAKSLVTLTRPRGYFTLPRDRISLDGASPPAGVPTGVGASASAKLKLADTTERSVAGEFNGERIVGRAWPVAENHVVVLELHY
jgi:triacylglycerol lipase